MGKQPYALAALLLVTLGPIPAFAATIQGSFTGTVLGGAPFPFSPVVAGDLITGTFSFDPLVATVSQNPSGTEYSYQPVYSPVSTTFAFGYDVPGETFSINTGASPGGFDVVLDNGQLVSAHFDPFPHYGLDLSFTGGDAAVGGGGYEFAVTSVEVSSVPLPPSLPLFGCVLVGLAAIARRRQGSARHPLRRIPGAA
ncbi:MAG: hypothetical protein M3N08_04390 [Pseudomonadota bacterium]|nr:hypothetical protein [Pseudomonadota bacterium]